MRIKHNLPGFVIHFRYEYAEMCQALKNVIVQLKFRD